MLNCTSCLLTSPKLGRQPEMTTSRRMLRRHEHVNLDLHIPETEQTESPFMASLPSPTGGNNTVDLLAHLFEGGGTSIGFKISNHCVFTCT